MFRGRNRGVSGQRRQTGESEWILAVLACARILSLHLFPFPYSHWFCASKMVGADLRRPIRYVEAYFEEATRAVLLELHQCGEGGV